MLVLPLFQFPPLQKQEQEATEERVFADRVAHVDCCVVRIMKTRKTIDHNTLLAEVYKQLQFPLKVMFPVFPTYLTNCSLAAL